MATKIIVSYDGSDNDRDALALGRLLGGAGATLELAYVRHALEAETGRERFAEGEATALLQAGAVALGQPEMPTHVVMSGSTSEGLRDLALREHADVIVFGSEYRTAIGHLDPQASARRLMDGGPVALALAPAGFAERGDFTVGTVAAIGDDGDPTAQEKAETLAARFGATVVVRGGNGADLMVVGSKPGGVTGRVTVSAAAEYLIELARCPVLVLARGVALSF
jgi:nucleotide-binding universal stress UspA family protein